MSTILSESLGAWWPEVILSTGALLVVLFGAWTKRSQPVLAVSWFTLLASAVALWHAPLPPDTNLFFGMIVCDSFSLVFRWFALASIALVLLMVAGSREVEDAVRGEYLGLLLFVGLGLMLMAESAHLLMAYVSMELVSLSSYLLVGLLRDARSAEASLKYLLFGALASGVMLFGMSWLFGLTGALDFQTIQLSSAGMSGMMTHALLVAIVLLLVGVAFKISMVPFHMWTPDAYEGAPMPVTALLSVGPKAAGLALLLRLMEALSPVWASVEPLVIVLAISTMTLGNLVAISQTNIKRLLAYSTIGQVGYLLIGFVVHTRQGIEALLVYLIAYLLMNLGAFACAVAVVNDTGRESLDAFKGLAHRAPILALLCALFLLSLAGIPPLLGFLGKFLLFGAAIASGHLWLAMAGVINSAIALYYYVNIIRQMYLLPSDRIKPFRVSLPIQLATSFCGVSTILLGLFPNALLLLIRAGSAVRLL